MPDKTPKFTEALKFAVKKHQGQIRKFSGKPYVTHPIKVAKIIEHFKPNSKNLTVLKVAALLHDCIEDTETTKAEIRNKFGSFVAVLVDELTSDESKIEKIGKADYLLQKMINLSDYGLVLKLADRLENVSDFPTATEKFRDKYRKETIHILEGLKKDRELTNTQKTIISAIEEKIQ